MLKVSGNEGTTWDAGDEIGIFMKTAGQTLSSSTIVGDASNKRYTTTGGTVVTFIPMDGPIVFPTTGNVDFIAYYPYRSVDVDFKVNIDVSNQSSQKDVILLYSDDATGKNAQNANVGLLFKHKMSKFVLTVNSEIGENINGLKIEFVGVKTQSVFSVIDGSLTDNLSSTGTILTLTAPNGAMSEAVLLPVTNLNDAKIKFTLGSKVYEWQIPDGTDYEGGKKYTYNFTLREKGVVLNGTGTIEGWDEVDGGDQDADEGDSETNLILHEQFGGLNNGDNSWTDAGYSGYIPLANYNHFDYFPPYTYSVAGTDVRVTTLNYAHFWIPAVADNFFQISGLPSGMTDIVLTFDLLAGTAGGRPANTLHIVCNGTVLSPTNSEMDTHNFTGTGAAQIKGFEINIPNGTTTVRFNNSNTDSGWRLANIKIVAEK